MTKNDIINAVVHRIPEWQVEYDTPQRSRMLDAYALSIVEQSVPGEMGRLELIPGVYEELDAQFADGHDYCRVKTLENARKILSPHE
jgi:hypothetical protein